MVDIRQDLFLTKTIQGIYPAGIGSGDDPSELSSIPVQRSAAVAPRHCLQHGQLRAARVPTKNRKRVLDDFAARIGQDVRLLGGTRAELLAFAGRGAPELEAIREHPANDLGDAAQERLLQGVPETIGQPAWALERRG